MSPIPFEIANSDFPIQSGPLIERRDTWYRTSGFRGSALGNSRCKGLTTRELAISRTPIAGGDPTSTNPRTSGYRSSGLRGFQYHEPLVSWIRDPRNPLVASHIIQLSYFVIFHVITSFCTSRAILGP
jgi:hypothetical protein